MVLNQDTELILLYQKYNMIILDELVRQNVINDLQSRGISDNIDKGTFLDVDDAMMSLGVDLAILKNIRSKLYNLPIYDKEIVFDSIVFKYFDEKEIREQMIFPIKFQTILSIGIVHPENEKTLEFISNKMFDIGTKYELFIISKED